MKSNVCEGIYEFHRYLHYYWLHILLLLFITKVIIIWRNVMMKYFSAKYGTKSMIRTTESAYPVSVSANEKKGGKNRSLSNPLLRSEYNADYANSSLNPFPTWLLWFLPYLCALKQRSKGKHILALPPCWLLFVACSSFRNPGPKETVRDQRTPCNANLDSQPYLISEHQ